VILTNVQERRASSGEIAPPPDFYTIEEDWEAKHADGASIGARAVGFAPVQQQGIVRNPG
jgi:hypothetical protein